MELALISPVNLLEYSGRTNYHLVLPHLLHHPRYSEFYSKVPGYKILDNGEAEGVQAIPSDLVKKAQQFGFDEVVVPDTIGDCNETIRRAREFKFFALENPNLKYMGVLQGKDMGEIMKCINAFVYSGYISVIGIPRVLANTIHRDIRVNLVEVIYQLFPEVPLEIHCLGASSNVMEVVQLSVTGVRGMDTSLPVVLGLECIDIKQRGYLPRQYGFFEAHADEIQKKWIDHNVETYMTWAGANVGA